MPRKEVTCTEFKFTMGVEKCWAWLACSDTSYVYDEHALLTCTRSRARRSSDSVFDSAYTVKQPTALLHLKAVLHWQQNRLVTVTDCTDVHDNLSPRQLPLLLSSFLYFVVHMCECHMSYLITYLLTFASRVFTSLSMSASLDTMLWFWCVRVCVWVCATFYVHSVRCSSGSAVK